MKILGLKEVSELLGISTKAATRILNTPGCPIFPRSKGQTFRIPDEAFTEWIKNYGKENL